MTTYFVAWTIDIEADSPEDAARIALTIQRDPESLATVFHVHPYTRAGTPAKRHYLVDVQAGGEA